MKYSNLIFDLDGTLWDSRATLVENWSEVLINFDLIQNPLKIDDMNQYMGLLPKDILRDLFPEISDEMIDLILIEIIKNENKIIRKYGGKLYKDVEETLNELKSKYDLYIVSNCQDGYIEGFIEFFGFEELFKDFLSHGKTGKSKDFNVQLLMQRNELIAESSVYIGDTSLDYEAATFNGLDFIYCNYGFGQMDDSVEDFQGIASLADLLKIL